MIYRTGEWGFVNQTPGQQLGSIRSGCPVPVYWVQLWPLVVTLNEGGSRGVIFSLFSRPRWLLYVAVIINKKTYRWYYPREKKNYARKA